MSYDFSTVCINKKRKYEEHKTNIEDTHFHDGWVDLF